MKKKGSVVEFNDQRDKELLQAFKSQLHLLGTVPLQEVSLAPHDARLKILGQRKACDDCDIINAQRKPDRIDEY